MTSSLRAREITFPDKKHVSTLWIHQCNSYMALEKWLATKVGHYQIEYIYQIEWLEEGFDFNTKHCKMPCWVWTIVVEAGDGHQTLLLLAFCHRPLIL